jgi:pSer/pThr/pTyr-binding forkhead associated (FHA) protein
MQIRLTVLGPRSGLACDVLVTAPTGTTLGAVAGALAASAGSGQPIRSSGSAVALYAGAQRLDPDNAVLGMPPLVDGAVLSLHAPADHGHHAGYHHDSGASAELHVIGGPDAGGVHLLHGGRVQIGRSAEADVPLDDPDVSRLHCTVTLDPQSRHVTVTDLGSTNGTSIDGRPVGERPVPLPPGALLRIGESTLRLEPGPVALQASKDGAIPAPSPTLPLAPDAEGLLHVCLPHSAAESAGRGGSAIRLAEHVPGPRRPDSLAGAPSRSGHCMQPPAAPTTSHFGGAAGLNGTALPSEPTAHGTGTSTGGRSGATDGQTDDQANDQANDQEEKSGGQVAARHRLNATDLHAPSSLHAPPSASPHQPQATSSGHGAGLSGAIGAWARRLAGAGRGMVRGGSEAAEAARLAARAAELRDRAPDAATVLVTALGPGPRLWERGVSHVEALNVRLGTTDLLAEGGLLPAVPVTADLRHTGSVGLTGPRPRLAGLARAVVAQLCALHSPSALELVLISADRARSADQRTDEWAWLTWLPHVRPAHGQDCRLLLAFDREQAEARTAELARRLDDGPLGPGWATVAPEAVAAASAHHSGPFTVVVVDGDPGSVALRDTVAHLAHAGPAVGIHLLCLAEQSELLAAECGTVAQLGGDVATTLSVNPPPAPDDGSADSLITVDAVSSAWAERFARALAPLREADGAKRRTRSSLPATARLLDELGLALATPAKISARWTTEATALAGMTVSPAARAVLGAGPEGSVSVDLVTEGPHLFIGGAAGSGKTELLRSVTAALAAATRPDRLALVLLDGAPERGEGLRVCTDLPHVSTYLAASDPARMREFAQALTSELKRREKLLDAWPGERRLVVVVDDLDALVAPALGSPGRPAAGSVIRAVEAVARAGTRLGVHLVASTGHPERTAGLDADERSRLRIALRTEDPESAALLVHVEDPAGLDDSVPGRGYLRRPDGAVTPFQSGRVSGRIPRTATLRPTVVPLEWERMGDPPTRRPLRELGNGPTDLALLASALQRAAESVSAEPALPLLESSALDSS